jgi:hypothetical protein
MEWRPNSGPRLLNFSSHIFRLNAKRVFFSHNSKLHNFYSINKRWVGNVIGLKRTWNKFCIPIRKPEGERPTWEV